MSMKNYKKPLNYNTFKPLHQKISIFSIPVTGNKVNSENKIPEMPRNLRIYTNVIVIT